MYGMYEMMQHRCSVKELLRFYNFVLWVFGIGVYRMIFCTLLFPLLCSVRAIFPFRVCVVPLCCGMSFTSSCMALTQVRGGRRAGPKGLGASCKPLRVSGMPGMAGTVLNDRHHKWISSNCVVNVVIWIQPSTSWG